MAENLEKKCEKEKNVIREIICEGKEEKTGRCKYKLKECGFYSNDKCTIEEKYVEKMNINDIIDSRLQAIKINVKDNKIECSIYDSKTQKCADDLRDCGFNDNGRCKIYEVSYKIEKL